MRWLFALLTGLVTGLSYPSPWFFFLSVAVYEVGLIVTGTRADPAILIPVAAGYVVGWWLAQHLRPTYQYVCKRYGIPSRAG